MKDAEEKMENVSLKFIDMMKKKRVNFTVNDADIVRSDKTVDYVKFYALMILELWNSFQLETSDKADNFPVEPLGYSIAPAQNYRNEETAAMQNKVAVYPEFYEIKNIKKIINDNDIPNEIKGNHFSWAYLVVLAPNSQNIIKYLFIRDLIKKIIDPNKNRFLSVLKETYCEG